MSYPKKQIIIRVKQVNGAVFSNKALKQNRNFATKAHMKNGGASKMHFKYEKLLKTNKCIHFKYKIYD